MVFCLSYPKGEKVPNHLSIVTALVNPVEQSSHSARRNDEDVAIFAGRLERLLDIRHRPARGMAIVHMLQRELGLVLKDDP